MPQMCRVLSVRESPADAALINELWGKDPYSELISCESGEAALNMLQSAVELPGLILLSSAPNSTLTAHELIVLLKVHPSWKVIPIVVFTSSLSQSDVNEWYELGVSSVIPMPSDLDAFNKNLAAIKHLWTTVATLPFTIDNQKGC